VKVRRFSIFLAILLVLAVGSMFFMSFRAKKPENLGVRGGRLAACPDSPNCVSSQATDAEHAMNPIPFSDSPEAAMKRVKETLAAEPRTRIVSEQGDYVHAEATSLLFRFVDDVEFYVDRQAGLIHFRSASRVGRSDLGVNRARMERITAALK
jgi:uncharacterized protein (DUF1499 family)